MEPPTSTPSSVPDAPAHVKKGPLSFKQRRVLGVLVEKAKTTPDAYPMSVNGLVTGSNQKSNRDPVYNFTDEQVQETLDELRALGAVAEVQGSGRVPRYRHYAKEYLGVSGVELAVMTELLLRGEQTIGDLRGRASRMEPIPDVAALKPVIESLVAKGQVIELTPPGRGQIVAHNYYKERELAELRERYANYSSGSDDSPEGSSAKASDERSSSLPQVSSLARGPAPLPAGNYVTRDMFSELEVEVAELRAEMARVREFLRTLQPNNP